ncbi:Myb family transcription factor [Actinidia chinensis var. chinensis]|uniref:Myb family transcription factor n=1 Tax=Actinidia chinensis var. chinensis TaxID=1590841 RepID=A0A2R6PPR4_ACTCC|nr:Myb family transcription factor [Actinidia chinensis var. chinensis]
MSVSSSCLLQASSLERKMKEIGDIEGSKANPLDMNTEDEEGCDHHDDENKPKTSASSSNSVADEEEKKASSSGVRQYIRSKVPRLRWTPDLHLCFLQAIDRLGGQERATPKLVQQVMNVKGLTIAHVKSHLQMYRSKKIDNQGQVINGRRYANGRADGFVDNFWQPFVLHQKLRSYKDVPWIGHENWISSSCIIDNTKGAFYVDNSKRFYQSQYQHSRQWHGNGGENVNYFFNNSFIPNTSWSTNGGHKCHTLKRRAEDNDLIDLNLSLSVKKSRQEEAKKTIWDDEVDSNLCLSLFSRAKKQNLAIDLNFPSTS